MVGSGETKRARASQLFGPFAFHTSGVLHPEPQMCDVKPMISTHPFSCIHPTAWFSYSPRSFGGEALVEVSPANYRPKKQTLQKKTNHIIMAIGYE
jgi:hypothetical protein